MKLISKNNKGFTLVEILIVLTLLVFLGTIAMGSYINANTKYQFISNYKNAISTLRTGRLYAVTNREIDNLEFEHYGVFINTYCIVLFADSGLKKLEFDPATNEDLGNNCLESNDEEISLEPADDAIAFSYSDYFFSDYDLNDVIKVSVDDSGPPTLDLDYDLDDLPGGDSPDSPESSDQIIQTKKFLFDDKNYYFEVDGLTMPLTIFYELSTGKVETFDNNVELNSNSLSIDFISKEENLLKSILFTKYSGLSEEI